MPPLGMALWLLKGRRLADRVAWLVANGFTATSLLQSVMEVDGAERVDAAAAMKAAGLRITYHGNVQRRLTAAGSLDTDFTARMIDDVIWWHENASGVFSCCSDPIHRPGDDGNPTFAAELCAELMRRLHAGLAPHGIRVGIENGFGGGRKFCTLASIANFMESCEVPGLGMLLDAGHANIHVRSDGVKGETEIGDFVRKLPLDVLEVHFSDNAGRKDEHRKLGQGNLDLRELLAALKQGCFRGSFTLEVCIDILSKQYGADIDDPGQTDPLLISRDALRAAWAELE
jgi:sugar phosphate isomerase/epimerase